MPVIQLKTNYTLTHEKQQELMTELRDKIAILLHKDYHNVMVTFSNEAILMGDSFEPAFYADIKYVSPDNSSDGMDKDTVCNEALSIIRKYTNIKPERVMIFFGTVSVKNAWKYTKK